LPALTSARGWGAEAADLNDLVSRVDQLIVDAVTIGRRPQLLPDWSSDFARNTIAYLGLVSPNALFTISLSLLGLNGGIALFLWFAVVFPAIAAVGGGVLVGRICAPRLSGPVSMTEARSPRRHHRWVAVVLAWASWLVPGIALDAIAAQVH
jgi:hypothetical protein